MKSFLNKVFKLEENGTTIRTEVLAGLTTFMTMAYIIALNPNLLTGFASGTDLWKGIFLATCIASAIGTICMAFLANKPFAMAPGMGLNSFFATAVSGVVATATIGGNLDSYEKAFQAMLIIILIEGVVFLVLSVFNIREKIVEAIPLGVRLGIAPAIGLMLMNIGFGSNAGIYSSTGGPYYAMRDFFGALSAAYAKNQMGTDGYTSMIISIATMFFGVFVICALSHRKVKGAVLYGMLSASALNWALTAIVLKTNPFASLSSASFLPPFKAMASTTLFKFNFAGFAEIGWATILTLIITFGIIDMFDTIGTLVGTASRANMVDEEGKMPQMKEALLSDAVGTVVGSCTGTSTVTTFIESASGVEVGGRTGLTALVTGVMFLLSMFLSPIAAIIPASATSAALIYVGILMLGNLKKVDFEDITQIVPVALMLIAMPISGSIGHAIGIALISYTVLKLCVGKPKDVSILTYILSVLFLVKFFVAF